MRTGAPSGRPGFYHEALPYDSDEELLDVVVPFIEGGVAAGEPTWVSLGGSARHAVLSAVGPRSGVEWLEPGQLGARPAEVIRTVRATLARLVAEGAEQVRVVNALPLPADGAVWAEWRRYEAAVNWAVAEFPMWGLCPYDRRRAPDHVLADVDRTHPFVATGADGHVENVGYQDPMDFLRAEADVPDPLERRPPDVEMVDPVPATAREALRTATRGSRIRGDALEAALFAVFEVVARALAGPRPPVVLRAWVGRDRLVVTVQGPAGPAPDSMAGLVPPGTGGAAPDDPSLWLAHLLAAMDRRYHDDRLSTRIIITAPSP